MQAGTAEATVTPFRPRSGPFFTLAQQYTEEYQFVPDAPQISVSGPTSATSVWSRRSPQQTGLNTFSVQDNPIADTESVPKILHPEVDLVPVPSLRAPPSLAIERVTLPSLAPLSSIYTEAMKPPKQAAKPTFNGAFISSLRSNTRKGPDTRSTFTTSTTTPAPTMFNQMLLSRKPKSTLMNTSLKSTLGYSLPNPPAYFKTPKPMVGKTPSFTPLHKAAIVFDDHLTDTPGPRTAKRALHARPALGDVTNTPVRPTALKKDTITETSALVKVRTNQDAHCSTPCMWDFWLLCLHAHMLLYSRKRKLLKRYCDSLCKHLNYLGHSLKQM